MLLVVGGRSYVGKNMLISILDTDDLTIEKVDLAELARLIASHKIAIYNVDACWNDITGCKLPNGLFVELGCGDIWYVSQGIIHIWNKVSGNEFSMSTFGFWSVGIYNQGYVMEFLSPSHPDNLFIIKDSSDLESHVNLDRGIPITRDEFKKKCLLDI